MLGLMHPNGLAMKRCRFIKRNFNLKTNIDMETKRPILGQDGNDLLAVVMRSIYNEMQIDTEFVDKSENFTKEYKKGFKEALRNLAVIIKQEENIDVR